MANRKQEIPAFHCCLLSAHCWKMTWKYGAPMGFFFNKWNKHFYVLKFLSNWRTDKMWEKMKSKVK